MQRAEILDNAMKCVCGQRVQDYGTPEDNFQRIADLWSAYMGGEPRFTPLDAAMMLALLKVARIKTGTGTDDCFVDLAGYAACAGEIAARQREQEETLILTPDIRRAVTEKINSIISNMNKWPAIKLSTDGSGEEAKEDGESD